MELQKLGENLENIRQVREDESEFWNARELYPLLGYRQWRGFKNAVEKAIESCKTSQQMVKDHFAGVRKMVPIGSGTERELDDFELSRYACYLIAQNGDPRIPEIAFAQMYFAIQTRKQEIIEQNIEEIERLIARKKLSETEKEFVRTIFSREVDSKGIQEIRSAGDKALFGGNSTKRMKDKLSVPTKEPLADYLPTVTIKAKDLATEMTTFNTKKKDLEGKHKKQKKKIEKL